VSETSNPGEVTLLLRRLSQGDGAALAALLPLLQGELRAMAHAHMKRQGPGHTLQTTALLHEAWLRLMATHADDYESRRHFLAVAATAMRSVLVDHARGKASQKRGGNRTRVPLEEQLSFSEEGSDVVLAVDEALERLAKLDPELARVAELRCFAGLSSADAALVLGVSKRTIERAWRTARAWLQRELDEAGDD
jgi:RNA polymerase sigma-70 factor, ECF subfamily